MTNYNLNVFVYCTVNMTEFCKLLCSMLLCQDLTWTCNDKSHGHELLSYGSLPDNMDPEYRISSEHFQLSQELDHLTPGNRGELVRDSSEADSDDSQHSLTY